MERKLKDLNTLVNNIYKNNELAFSLFIIFLYLLINTLFESIAFRIVVLLLFIFIIGLFIKSNNLFSYLRLNKKCKLKNIYLIILYLFSTFNIFDGIDINNIKYARLVLMIIVGIIEELIFRGFLFKALESKSIKSAIYITSISFGIGHILNLFNGMNIIENILQIVFALCIGFMYGFVLIKGDNLYPCIISHVLIDSISMISVETNNYCLYIVLIIFVVIYTLIVRKSL